MRTEELIDDCERLASEELVLDARRRARRAVAVIVIVVVMVVVAVPAFRVFCCL